MPNATVIPAMVPDAGVGSVLKMSGALFFILAMLLLVYYLLRRMNLAGSFSGARKGCLQIVDRLSLGPHQNISVIKYRGREMVVGVTQERITLLHAGDKGHAATDSDFSGYLEKENSGTSEP